MTQTGWYSNSAYLAWSAPCVSQWFLSDALQWCYQNAARKHLSIEAEDLTYPRYRSTEIIINWILANIISNKPTISSPCGVRGNSQLHSRFYLWFRPLIKDLSIFHGRIRLAQQEVVQRFPIENISVAIWTRYFKFHLVQLNCSPQRDVNVLPSISLPQAATCNA